MRLTEILCRYKKALPRGHIWRGKYRLYKEVTPSHIHNLQLEYALEEKNMFYLRHPYLTIEESLGHARELGKRTNFFLAKEASKTWKEHKYLGDRFGFLKVADAWE